MSAGWWWVGVTDNAMPKGERAIGAIVLAQVDEANARVRALVLLKKAGRLSAGLELNIAEVPREWRPPPPGSVDRLLPRAEAEALASTWGQGVATPEDIKEAFLDDEAKPGDPLFRRPR